MSLETGSFAALSDEVVTGLFAFQPANAQNAGDHRFDGQTGDFSPDNIRRRIHELERQAAAIQAARPTDPDEEADRLTLLAQVELSLFQLRDRREHERNPMFYFGRHGIGDVGRYTRRRYAPLPERVESLIRHLRAIPDTLRQVDQNLAPELSAAQLQIAREEIQRYPPYFERDLMQEIDGDLAPEQRSRLDQARAAAAEAMRWFDGRLAARTTPPGDRFALGEPEFRALLRYREMVDLSADDLLRVAWSDLEQNAAALKEEAERLAPGRSVPEVVEQIEADHTSAQELVPFVDMVLERLRSFLIEHDVVSVPSEVRIRAAPTPGYRRAGTAMTDSPGPLETVATESYYYITLPQPDWSEKQREAWLRYLNRATVENVSAHEAYPGHYVHTLHRHRVRSVPRAVFRSQGFGEGWGHYAEQVMQEVGYAPADNPGLRFMQLRDALLRDCRFVAAVSMHCRDMSVDEATRLFTERAYLPEVAARREALRGSHDVLYLNYTLGKLQILKLREDCRRLERGRFNLKRFHDAILDTGAPPVAVVRKLVLGSADDGRVL